MPFPNVPFILNKKPQVGDRELLNYLKANISTFSYLRTARNDIKRINSFRDKKIFNIWPKILTDVLLTLKKQDIREYDKKNPKMSSFFDENSLGVDELEEMFKGFFEFEGMMYGASPDHYRDHVVHSFRTWIIGHAVLEHCFNNKLSTYADESLKISEIEWKCMWAIVALCHDIGYPLAAIEKINQKARSTLRKQGIRQEGDLRFTFSPQMLLFHESVIKLMSSKPILFKVKGKHRYLTHLQNKYYLKFLKSFDNLDHGIISSLLISTSLVYFLESDLCQDDEEYLKKEDARQFLIRREILRAISSHTCQDIYHLHFNTLSFLLYIVDEIQCWGRPTFEQLRYETKSGENFVNVSKLNKDAVDVRITVPDKNKWSRKSDKMELAKAQVGRLRKRLRLAVGTREFFKKSFLRYEIKNIKGNGWFLELKDKRLIFRSLPIRS